MSDVSFSQWRVREKRNRRPHGQRLSDDTQREVPACSNREMIFPPRYAQDFHKGDLHPELRQHNRVNLFAWCFAEKSNL